MNVVVKSNIKYELGTGGKIKDEFGVEQYSENDTFMYFKKEDGTKIAINTRFIISAEIYEEKSFD